MSYNKTVIDFNFGILYTIIDLCWGGEQKTSIWFRLLFNNTPCLPKHKSTIVCWYNKSMLQVCISCHVRTLKPLTLLMDHAKLLDVLTLLPLSHAILPCVVCFATSRLAYHAMWQWIVIWANHNMFICRLHNKRIYLPLKAIFTSALRPQWKSLLWPQWLTFSGR